MQARLLLPTLLTLATMLFSLAAGAADSVAGKTPPPQSAPAAQAVQAVSHVQTRLLADTKAIKAGVPFKLGVEFVMEPHWHIYYKENGEAGMPTAIDWKLPKGFKASDLEWEKPSKFDDAGIITFGYQGKTVIAATITPPADLPASSAVQLDATVKFLACKDLCLPGKTQLSLTLPSVGANGAVEKDNQESFSKLGFNGSVSDLPAPAGHPAGPGAGPDDAQAASQAVAHAGTEPTPPRSGKSILDEKITVVGGEETSNLFSILALAFVGGFILNFMPCVLPVISIKVLSFMQQAGEEPKRVFTLGLTFTAGIVSSFMVLAAIVVACQQAGQRVGWGFQFQYPVFLLAMSAVILFFALSMFGLFYIQVSAGQAQVDKLASKEGLAGTFFKGVLATILSTPCTAPALGTALGFAFTQPWWVICLVFFTIAMGMSSPYILLTANPGWMKYIPKPGVWMEKFKEGMGFLMLATAVWLLWVLAQQVGINAALSAAGFLVAMSFAVWVVGSFIDLTASGKRRAIVYSIAAVILGLAFKFLLLPYPQLLSTDAAVASPTPAVASAADLAGSPESADEIKWQAFTIATLDKYRSENKTIFLDFTADWCLTCKVNESQVISTPAVMQKFKALNVVALKADWTRQDPQITALLSKFGRSGVPLYVIFPAGKPDQAIVLPEVISQQVVIDSLAKAGPSK